jgi:hypothetical protein
MRKQLLIVSALLLLCSSAIAADNLRLNPKLDFSSDSQDGPLITGDHMEEGALAGKPNYLIFYAEG